jgi:hypothetical protein
MTEDCFVQRVNKVNQMKLYTKDNKRISLIKRGSWIENSSLR